MNYDLNNRITVCPQIVIYKNLVPNVSDVFNFLKETENNMCDYLPKWEEWRPTNNTPGALMRIRTMGQRPSLDSTDTKKVIDEKNIVNMFYDVFEFARNDYLNNWANKGNWPKFITNWDWLDNNNWQNHELNILKYEMVDSGGDHDPKNGIYNLPMNYHVDNMPTNEPWRGSKNAITITMYLNDNYNGGEISFYDDENKKVYHYKPKAGDVTVFPGFDPFYHGVLPMSGDPRYLVRSFWMYMSDGTEEWNNEVKNMSNDEIQKQQKEMLEKAYHSGDHCIRILYDDDIDTEKYFRVIRIKTKPIIIE